MTNVCKLAWPTFAAGEPAALDSYCGQQNAKEVVKIALAYAKQQENKGKIRRLPHILITGPAGYGKTTLAKLIAKTNESTYWGTTGNNLDTPGALLSLFTQSWRAFEQGQTVAPVIFIDEIHALPKKIAELLYVPLAEDKIDIGDKRYDAPPWTLIAATTESGTLPAPFLSRFEIRISLDRYTMEDILKIIKNRAAGWGIQTKPGHLKQIAERSRLTPRIAVNHLKFSTVSPNPLEYFRLQDIDDNGLAKQDRKILSALHKAGRPCSLKSIATMTGVNESEIAAEWEPYLVQLGFIVLTARGRSITDDGILYLNGDDDLAFLKHLLRGGKK